MGKFKSYLMEAGYFDQPRPEPDLPEPEAPEMPARYYECAACGSISAPIEGGRCATCSKRAAGPAVVIIGDEPDPFAFDSLFGIDRDGFYGSLTDEVYPF